MSAARDSAPGAPSALAALRAATASRHAALDASLPLAQPGAGPADYVAHLQRLRPWLQAADAALAATGRGGAAPLLAGIDADLATAGAAPLAHAVVPALPADGAAAWGVAYVVEGSQLGGQVLLRRLAGPLAPWPLRYLRGRGADTGAHWRAFAATLEAALAPAQWPMACAGAQQAFDTWPGVPPRHRKPE